VFIAWPFSVEQPRLGRRPARRPPGSFWRGAFLIEVGEDLLDHFWVLDAGDDPHRPTAGRAGLHVDVEHPFQALGLRLIEARRSAGVGSSASPVAARRPPLPRFAGVTRPRYRLLGANTPL